MRSIFNRLFNEFRSIFDDLEDIFGVWRAFGKHFQQGLHKVALRGPTIFVKIPVLGDFWDPAGAPKSVKNGPGIEKVRPQTVPEPIF